MDERVKLLRRVCRSQWFSSISTEELKLYLLLLVWAARIGHEGQIPWRVLKRGLGSSLTAEKMRILAKALRRHGLARMRLSDSPGGAARQRKGSTLEVRFTVLDLGRMRGSTPGRRHHKREAGNG